MGMRRGRDKKLKKEVAMDAIRDAIGKLDNAEEKYGLRMVLAAFEELEKELEVIAKEAPSAHNPGIYELKARLANLIGNTNASVSRFQGILVNLTRKGWDIINAIWKWFTGNLLEILAKIGNKLGVTGYSIGTTTGFPQGLSTTITVHFTIEPSR